jgi:hypothetical protein
MSKKTKQRKQQPIMPEMRLKESELFELAHVVRVRPVFKDGSKGIGVNLI